MVLVSGVDGGATKTVVVVGTLDGTLLGSARVRPSNYHNIGIRKASKAIRSGLLAACQHGRVSVKDLQTVVMGLAGMDSPGDFRAGRQVANLLGLGKRRIVKHDSVIALYAATLGAPGIVVNAGTGSFAAGLDEHGRAIRAGGWGNVVNDEGSAFHIGKLGIRAALRALDGMERKTRISRLLIRDLRLRTLEDIVHRVYRKPMTVEDISAISTLVTEAALNGDRVARGIFAHEGQVLARLTSTIARRLGTTRRKPCLYLTGGVFNAGSVIISPFRRELRKEVSTFVIRRPVFEPVVGAYLLALSEQGVRTSGQVLVNLQASYARHLKRIK